MVVCFAIAMAWVEAASVLYIRALVGRIEPYQANPLPLQGALGTVELWREASTLVMLGTVGILAGTTWRRRIGYAALAFGVWDIFYYVFLRLISGWPKTLLDWDILFLLPLPWWGPVLAPVMIALVMIPVGHAGHADRRRVDRCAMGEDDGPGWSWDRAGCLHGRRMARAAGRPGRGVAGIADDVQLAGVLGVRLTHRAAGPASSLASEARPEI
jgi:hypothetical protein